MAGSNAEKSTYTGFERLLFFLTPILFTAVLLGVLLLLFNSDWRQSALKIGHKVPLLSSVLPEPKKTEDTAANLDELTVSNARKKVDELNAQLLNQQTALQQEKDKTTEQTKTIDNLKSQIAELNKQTQEKTLSTEEYDSRIRALSDMYGKMTPGKAAPILEQMTVEEATLVLGSMAETQRGRILEKMTPKVAADVTTRLKDSESVRDQELAALQARIDELQKQTAAGTDTLDSAQLKLTFGSMQPKKAATLLLQMATTNPSKTLRVLGVLDDASRSQVLAAMSDENSKATAQLVGKLMPANP